MYNIVYLLVLGNLVLGSELFPKKLNLVFYILFNSKGHIGTGHQHSHLYESNPHRVDYLWLDAKLAYP